MYSGIVVNCRHLNIRESASTDSTVVGTVDAFDKIKTTSGVEGYCAKTYIGKLENEHGECVHTNSTGVTWDDITDKLFVDQEETLAEGTVSNFMYISNSDTYSASFDCDFDFEIGDKVVPYYGGYPNPETEIKYVDDNTAMIGDDTFGSMPFYIYIRDRNTIDVRVPSQPSGSVTIQINKKKKVLDPDILPSK